MVPRGTIVPQGTVPQWTMLLWCHKEAIVLTRPVTLTRHTAGNHQGCRPASGLTHYTRNVVINNWLDEIKVWPVLHSRDKASSALNATLWLVVLGRMACIGSCCPLHLCTLAHLRNLHKLLQLWLGIRYVPTGCKRHHQIFPYSLSNQNQCVVLCCFYNDRNSYNVNYFGGPNVSDQGESININLNRHMPI